MPQRSPVIFWLLLAATLCVDAVAIALLFENTDRVATAFFFAIAYSQLGVLCVWSVLSRSVIGLRWLLPFGGGIAVGFVSVALHLVKGGDLEGMWTDFLGLTAYMWLFAVFVVLQLWLLKPSHLFAAYSINKGQRGWQFGLKHLLLVMTCVPILLLVFKQSPLTSEGQDHLLFIVLPWSAASAALPVAGAVAVHFRRHWVLRLATILSFALAVGACCEMNSTELVPGTNQFACFLIQAVVIWAWLETLRASHSGSKIATDEIATAGASQ